MTCKQKTATRKTHQRRVERNAKPRRKRTKPTNICRFFESGRGWPKHKPIERTMAVSADGFELVGGWQIKYAPSDAHRAWLFSVECAKAVAEEASLVKAKAQISEALRTGIGGLV